MGVRHPANEVPRAVRWVRAARGLRPRLRVICRKASAVHVDHRHETGRVRGVPCFNCDTGVGMSSDGPEAAYRAADYLEGNAWKPTLVAPGVYQLPS
ncbi:endonuclease domain-containing protein [Streptomyces sp. NPDC086077]|uniref:endonuclease domain-containing protein n=1 Tax=Streptomyces sp. NPDC086077 TaxID=3154862 RepID=UPI0034384FA5